MRLANKNEQCLALNEVNYKCDSDMIVISDDEITSWIWRGHGWP